MSFVGLLSHERKARAESENRALRISADHVSTWWQGVRRFDPTPEDEALGAELGFAVTVIVRNGGNQPVYDVIVDMAETPIADQSPADYQILNPGQTVEGTVLDRRHPDPNPDKRHEAGWNSLFGIPRVSFTDTLGQRWCRDERGMLSRVSGELPPYSERIREDGELQDRWFAKWSRNPFTV